MADAVLLWPCKLSTPTKQILNVLLVVDTGAKDCRLPESELVDIGVVREGGIVSQGQGGEPLLQDYGRLDLEVLVKVGENIERRLVADCKVVFGQDQMCILGLDALRALRASVNTLLHQLEDSRPALPE